MVVPTTRKKQFLPIMSVGCSRVPAFQQTVSSWSPVVVSLYKRNWCLTGMGLSPFLVASEI